MLETSDIPMFCYLLFVFGGVACLTAVVVGRIVEKLRVKRIADIDAERRQSDRAYSLAAAIWPEFEQLLSPDERKAALRRVFCLLKKHLEDNP